ncbi:hypothetical protein [Undibacterium squillarum]|uniref:hypothetical protein n=1 Tax=Undibacterium squillarum TaxID=1131567 RepID=UPI0035B2DF9B
MGDMQRVRPGTGETDDVKEKRAGMAGVRVPAVSRCKASGEPGGAKQTGNLLDGDKKTPRSFQTAVFFRRLTGNYPAGAVMFILQLLQLVLLLLPVL